jgi:hypothetical protein
MLNKAIDRKRHVKEGNFQVFPKDMKKKGFDLLENIYNHFQRKYNYLKENIKMRFIYMAWVHKGKNIGT